MKKDKIKPEELMTGYEIRRIHGYKKTPADQIKDKAMFRNAVKNRLAMEEKAVLPSGEVVNVSAVELLVDAKFNDDMNNPDRIDLTKWAKAAGEDTSSTEVSVKGADELFGDIVNK